MATLPQKLTLHLLAATSFPLVVAAALAGLSALAGWLDAGSFEQRLIHAAMPVLGGLAIAMYVFYFVQIVRAYRRGQSLLHTTNPPPAQPPPYARVTREHWDGVAITFFVFLLLVGIGMIIGLPAKAAHADRFTYYSFLLLEHSTLFIGAAGLVFSITLMTTHALRGVLRSFTWEAHGDRPTERRRNLPLDVALTALPMFVAVLVI